MAERNPKSKIRNPKLTALASRLLDWFAANARDLPWRRARDPYAVWVSEIMLQQTQVKTVVPYWERWMRALPTIRALADAPSAKLHKLWEGLGYYSRVRNLQNAARQIMRHHGGRFPERFEDVLALPGIGRYTAGAICSIAFNQPAPLLDGNVIRVLTRLFGIGGNPRQARTNARLWRLAEELVQCAVSGAARSQELQQLPRASLFNQSLMELGALVCTPRRPKCALCPVARNCVARREGRVDELPNPAWRPVPTARRFAAFVVEDRGRFLVRQRPAGGVNARLWEFPNFEITRSDGAPRSELRRVLGFAPLAFEPLCVVKHSITRYRMTLEVFAAKGNGRRNGDAPGRWLTFEQLEKLPFAAAHRKIIRRLPH